LPDGATRKNMKPLFISVDWGTSSFRLRCVDATAGRIVHEFRSGEGIASLYQRWLGSGLDDSQRHSFYLRPLFLALQTFPDELRTGLPVIISGMASSSMGIRTLPYLSLPLSLKTGHLLTAQLDAGDNDVILVSGLQTGDDVMRGEETILLGIAEKINEGLIILPGTHSKHVILSGGQLMDFKTFMTGELFELLWKQSTLSATVNPASDTFNRDAFLEGLRAAREGNLLNLLFHARTRQLLQQIPGEDNFDWLSGLLIGTEMLSVPPSSQKIVLSAEGLLQNRYQLAIEQMWPDKMLQCVDADTSLIKGQCILFRQRWPFRGR